MMSDQIRNFYATSRLLQKNSIFVTRFNPTTGVSHQSMGLLFIFYFFIPTDPNQHSPIVLSSRLLDFKFQPFNCAQFGSYHIYKYIYIHIMIYLYIIIYGIMD